DQRGTSLAADGHRVEGVVGDDGVGIGKTRSNVVSFQLGVVGKDRGLAFTLRQQTQDQLYRDSHAPYDRFPAEDVRIRLDSLEELWLCHGFSLSHQNRQKSPSQCASPAYHRESPLAERPAAATEKHCCRVSAKRRPPGGRHGSQAKLPAPAARQR